MLLWEQFLALKENVNHQTEKKKKNTEFDDAKKHIAR